MLLTKMKVDAGLFKPNRLCHGRTLHYSIVNSSEITDEEKDTIYTCSQSMNTGVFENVWTCENFFLDPYAFYPNWKKEELKDINGESGWDIINKMYFQRMKENKGNRSKVLKGMEKEGWIGFHDKDIIRGFTKVQGNEYNSLLVLSGLLFISLQTKAIISLCDEGRFLYAGITIKDGLVKIDKKDYEDDKQHWKEEGWLESNYEGMADDVKVIDKLLKEHPSWMKSDLAHRKVNPADFSDKNIKKSQTQIMSGFYGEHWELSDKDAELESYKMVDMITKKFGGEGVEIQVNKKI